jgi:hypothetical protein
MIYLGVEKRDESKALIAVTSVLISKSITQLSFVLASINE